MRRLALVALLAAALAALTACGGEEAEQASSTPTAENAPASGNKGGGPADRGNKAFEVALGEWALTTEADSIRPGQTTFVVTNRGTMPHGFEIEREDRDDDEDKLETRVLEAGESVEVELNLSEGVYKLECNVEGHDDMGMEMLLEVSRDAPRAAKPAASSQPAAVAIEAFAFAPADDHDTCRRGDHLGEPRPGRPHGHGRGRLLRLRDAGAGRHVQDLLRQPG